MVRYSFLVGLLPPRLHAGLSRRLRSLTLGAFEEVPRKPLIILDVRKCQKTPISTRNAAHFLTRMAPHTGPLALIGAPTVRLLS